MGLEVVERRLMDPVSAGTVISLIGPLTPFGRSLKTKDCPIREITVAETEGIHE